jgi:predicted dehydrogenase
VTGLSPVEVCAEVGAASPLSPNDDTALLMLRYETGARGLIWLTVAAGGAVNGLKLRVHGNAGGLEWRHAQPEELIYTQVDAPQETRLRGMPGEDALASAAGRMIPGLPEGFLEAFANLYRDFAEAVRARQSGRPLDPRFSTFPTISDGVKALEFAEAVYRSAVNGSAWTRV